MKHCQIWYEGCIVSIPYMWSVSKTLIKWDDNFHLRQVNSAGKFPFLAFQVIISCLFQHHKFVPML